MVNFGTAKILSVKPPDEDETERDELCLVCPKLPPAPERTDDQSAKGAGVADRVCYWLRHCRRSKKDRGWPTQRAGEFSSWTMNYWPSPYL